MADTVRPRRRAVSALVSRAIPKENDDSQVVPEMCNRSNYCSAQFIFETQKKTECSGQHALAGAPSI
jgi:hypothetical protein